MHPVSLITSRIEDVDAAQVVTLLKAHGAVLIRGARMSAARLETLSREMFPRFHQPAIRSELRWQEGDGYSSRVRKDTRLLGHAEAYYRPCFSAPDVCLFACEKAPFVAGGETFLIDGAEMYRALPEDLANRLATEGVIYEARWMPERWQGEFGVSNVNALRRLLDNDGRCEYELTEGGELHLLFRTVAIQTSAGNDKRFINGMLAHLPLIDHPRYASVPVFARPANRMYWGSGDLIDNDTVCRLIDVHDSVLYKHRWQDGDLLLLDNHRFLHGREIMTAPGDRVIFSRFGYWS